MPMSILQALLRGTRGGTIPPPPQIGRAHV